MFRAIFELLLTAIVVLFLRAVIGIVMKGFRQTMQPQPQPQPPVQSQPQPQPQPQPPAPPETPEGS